MRKTTLHLLLAVVLLLAAQAAFAADQITVTVTLQNIAFNVSPPTRDFGTMAPGTSASTYVSPLAGAHKVTNDGNVSLDFTIVAAATTPSGWTPGTSAGVDTFVIGFGIGTDPYTSEPTYTPITTTSIPLWSGLAPGETADKHFDLQMTAPLAGSTFDAGGEMFTLTVAASAS